MRKKNAKENYQTNYPPEIFIQKEKAYTISSFDFLLGHFLQVGCEKSFVLLLFLFGQISEALDFSPALYVPAETVGEVLDFIVSHGIVIGQFFSCFNVPVGFVDPVGPIKPDTAVGIAGMIDASAYLSEHDPLIHSNLTGMRIVGAIIFLYLTGIDYISSFQVFSSVKSLTLLAWIFFLTIVFCHFIITCKMLGELKVPAFA